MPDNPDSTVSAGGVILSDVLGKAQDIAIFSGLTRDIDSVSDRLDDSNRNTTVLAPANTVVRGLKRKPWEDPKDYESFGETAYGGSEGEERAHRNLRRFVEAHIVPESPWKENSKVRSLSGTELWYELKDGKKTVWAAPMDDVLISIRLTRSLGSRSSPKVLRWSVLRIR